MPTIGLVALEGAHLTGLAHMLDLFDSVNRYTQGLYEQVEETRAPTSTLILTTKGRPCRLANGRELAADGSISAAPACDLVFLASVRVIEDDIDVFLSENDALIAWIANRWRSGATIAASGASTLLLAASGALDEQPATTPWWLERAFRQRFAKPKLDISRIIAEGERTFCAGTPRGEPALALRLVERLLSRNVANWAAKVTTIDAYPDGPEPWTVFSPEVLRQDGMVGRAQHWLQQRFSQHPSMSELADAMAVSERTLTRRFKASLGMTPLEYLQTLRVEAAKQMLARSSRRIDRIAYLVGYGDVGFFSKVFRERAGMSPRDFRLQAAAARAPRAE